MMSVEARRDLELRCVSHLEALLSALTPDEVGALESILATAADPRGMLPILRPMLMIFGVDAVAAAAARRPPPIAPIEEAPRLRRRPASAQALWKLLDDISTLSDACGDDDADFRRRAYDIAEKRLQYFVSRDGQTLTTPEAD